MKILQHNSADVIVSLLDLEKRIVKAEENVSVARAARRKAEFLEHSEMLALEYLRRDYKTLKTANEDNL